MAARYVTDTTVWRLVVPLAAPLVLTGSRLTAVFRPTFGGPAVAEVSTDDGSIALANDPQTGKTVALRIAVSVAARAGWRVQSNTPLAFDVHRYASAQAEPEWPGRQFVTVVPGTDSDAVDGTAFAPVFTQAQPCDGPNGLLLPALTTGPQGAPGAPGSSDGSGDLAFLATTALSGHRAVCCRADGALAYAAADDEASVEAYAGVTISGAAAGAPVMVRAAGEMTEPSWSWSPGPVYLGSDGALVQPEPPAGAVLVVGIAIAPTRLLLSAEPPVYRG